jgi:hypothetical protein
VPLDELCYRRRSRFGVPTAADRPPGYAAVVGAEDAGWREGVNPVRDIGKRARSTAAARRIARWRDVVDLELSGRAAAHAPVAQARKHDGTTSLAHFTLAGELRARCADE